MQNLKYVGMKRRGVMTEQNRSSFAVVTFYTTSALVTALQFSSPAPPSPTWSPNQLNSVPFLRCAYRGTNFPSKTRIISGRCSPAVPSSVYDRSNAFGPTIFISHRSFACENPQSKLASPQADPQAHAR